MSETPTHKRMKSRKIILMSTALIILVILSAINELFWVEQPVFPVLRIPQQNKPQIAEKKQEKVGGAMEYIYNAPESENDTRYEYQWEILKTALEKTREKYGPYTMKKAK